MRRSLTLAALLGALALAGCGVRGPPRPPQREAPTAGPPREPAPAPEDAGAPGDGDNPADRVF